jgi:VWFA-related protein
MELHRGGVVWGMALLATAGLALAQEAAPQASGVTIHSTVQEVVLEVVVRDAKGKTIRNLKPGEMVVIEDGVRRPVTSFRWVPGRVAMAEESAAAAPAAEPGAPVAVKPAPAARTLPSVNLVCLVFHNLDPDSRPWAMVAVEEFLKNEFRPGTWVATFSLGANSRLELLHKFTNSREELANSLHDTPTGINADFMQAASSVLNATPTSITIGDVVSGSGAGTNAATSLDINGGDLNTQAFAGAEVSTGQGAKIMRGQQADFKQEFGHIEGMREADQIISMFEGLGKLPGRKTVLLLSPGLIGTGDPEYFEKIVKRARRSDITVYAIDINGLTQNSNAVGANAALRYQAGLSRGAGRGGLAQS